MFMKLINDLFSGLRRSSGVVVCSASALLLLLLLSTSSHAQAVSFNNAVKTLGSGFNHPYGVAVDPAGNLFVADTDNNAVKEILAVGGYTTINTLGSGFSYPTGVAVDSTGNVFVADAEASAVYEILAAGGFTTVKTIGSGFNWPYGVAVDAANNLFVADTGNGAVKELTAASSYTTINTLGSGFSQPWAVAIDAADNVFVSDNGNVKEILAVGGYATVNSPGSGLFGLPYGIAVDSADNIYVVDTTYNAVREISPSTGYSSVSSPGIGLNLPIGVAVDSMGNVFVADTNNNLIKEISASGSFGNVNVGSTSVSSISMLFYFNSAATVGSVSVLTQGATKLDFNDAKTGTCVAGSYATNQICSVNVNFTPIYSGTRYGAVELLDASGNLLATGYIQGTGVGPQITYPSAALIIPNVSSSPYVDPDGLAVDGSGNLYIADEGYCNFGCSVFKLKPIASSDNNFTLGYVEYNNLDNPLTVAIDGAGNVYGTAGGAWGGAPPQVFLYAPLQNGSYAAPIPIGTFIDPVHSTPGGVTVDGAGNIYIVDNGLGKVYKETLSNHNYTYTQTTIASGLTAPWSIAVDGSGNVYTGNGPSAGNPGIVYKLTRSGSTYSVSTIGSGWIIPNGVKVDGNGNVYVADEGGTVSKLTPSGSSYIQSTLIDSSAGLSPLDIAIDGSGNLYIGDGKSGHIYEKPYGTPPSLSFAATAVGTTSADSAKTITVQNFGNAPLTFATIGYPVNFPEATGIAGDCLASAPLAANSTCTLTIDFTPTVAGSLRNQLTLTDNALNASSAKQTIQLTGNAH